MLAKGGFDVSIDVDFVRLRFDLVRRASHSSRAGGKWFFAQLHRRVL
jgi:hypothetical protein